jgi:hypothetical protein
VPQLETARRIWSLVSRHPGRWQGHGQHGSDTAGSILSLCSFLRSGEHVLRSCRPETQCAPKRALLLHWITPRTSFEAGLSADPGRARSRDEKACRKSRRLFFARLLRRRQRPNREGRRSSSSSVRQPRRLSARFGRTSRCWRGICGSRRSSSAELEENFNGDEDVYRVNVRAVGPGVSADCVTIPILRVEKVRTGAA